jgi:hypothetical protein
MTLEEYIVALKRAAAEVPAGIEAGLHEAGALIEKEAKAEIGTYQRGSTGPFGDWPELADYTKEDRLKRGFTENDPGLRTGEMRDSIGHTVHGESVHIGSNDDKLKWFELGTQGKAGEMAQPPRSVLGVAMFRHGRAAADLALAAVMKFIFKA